MRLAAVSLAVLAAAGCQSAQSTGPASGTNAYATNTALGKTIGACWFSGDPMFAGYIYAPENNAGGPRILIVAKDEPQGRPVLVIEPKGGGKVEVYGPLLQSERGPRINADIARWRTGAEGCAA